MQTPLVRRQREHDQAAQCRIGDSPAWVICDQPNAAECRHGRDDNSGQSSHQPGPPIDPRPDQNPDDTNKHDHTGHEHQHASGGQSVAVEGSPEFLRHHALKGEGPHTGRDEHDASGAHEDGRHDQLDQAPSIRSCPLSRGIRRGRHLRHQNPLPAAMGPSGSCGAARASCPSAIATSRAAQGDRVRAVGGGPQPAWLDGSAWSQASNPLALRSHTLGCAILVATLPTCRPELASRPGRQVQAHCPFRTGRQRPNAETYPGLQLPVASMIWQRGATRITQNGLSVPSPSTTASEPETPASLRRAPQAAR